MIWCLKHESWNACHRDHEHHQLLKCLVVTSQQNLSSRSWHHQLLPPWDLSKRGDVWQQEPSMTQHCSCTKTSKCWWRTYHDSKKSLPPTIPPFSPLQARRHTIARAIQLATSQLHKDVFRWCSEHYTKLDLDFIIFRRHKKAKADEEHNMSLTRRSLSLTMPPLDLSKRRDVWRHEPSMKQQHSCTKMYLGNGLKN